MSGTATTNKSVLSHLKPMNLQIFFDDSDPLMHYKFIIGISDLDGAVIYDPMETPVGAFKPLNGNGLLVYPKVLADPRGGMLTVVSVVMNAASGESPAQLRHTCRHGKIGGGHMLFEATLIKAAETETSGQSSNKTTLGGKAGLSYGIGSGEISGSNEHQGPTRSIANAYAGAIKDITFVWIAK